MVISLKITEVKALIRAARSHVKFCEHQLANSGALGPDRARRVEAELADLNSTMVQLKGALR